MKKQIFIILFFCFLKGYCQELEQETKILNGKIKKVKRNAFSNRSLQVLLKYDASGLIPFINSEWGPGQFGAINLLSMGAELDVIKKSKKNTALGLSLGVIGQNVTTNFSNNEINYTTTNKFTQLKAMIGPKIGRKFFIFPKVGISQNAFNSQLDKYHISSDKQLKDGFSVFQAGLEIGKIILIYKNFKIQPSFQYSGSLPKEIKLYYFENTTNNSMHFLSLKLGIGF